MWRTSGRRSRCCIVDIFGAGRHHLAPGKGASVGTCQFSSFCGCRVIRSTRRAGAAECEGWQFTGSASAAVVEARSASGHPGAKIRPRHGERCEIGTPHPPKVSVPLHSAGVLPSHQACRHQAPEARRRPCRRACATEIDPNACIRGDLRRGREPAPRAPRAVSHLNRAQPKTRTPVSAATRPTNRGRRSQAGDPRRPSRDAGDRLALPWA